MAILDDGEYQVKINFSNYEYGWVYYQFEYLYKNQPIFDYKVYPKEFMRAEEYREDSIIPTLKRVEENNSSFSWQTDEPYLIIEIIYSAKLGWEEAKQNKNVYYRSEKLINELKEVDKLREKSGGKLEDDCFRFLFLIGQPMSSSGPAFMITVTRRQLKEFIKSFEAEYKEFFKKNEQAIRDSFIQAGMKPPTV